VTRLRRKLIGRKSKLLAAVDFMGFNRKILKFDEN
jgi:hypothetical protein